MVIWEYALWGFLGGAAVEALELATALRRSRRWPWRRAGMLAPYVVGKSIRIGVSVSLAMALGASTPNISPLILLLLGAAAPGLLTSLVRTSTRTAEAEIAPPSVYGESSQPSAELLDKLVSDLPATVRVAVAEAISSSSNESPADRNVSLVQELQARRSQMQDLAHSLNTPLARVEAIALVMNDGGTVDRAAEKLLGSVDICKAFIAAFVELNSIGNARSATSLESLAEAIQRAASVYIDGSGSTCRAAVNLPSIVEGYSNSYLAALLLPLLENAVEAATEDSSLSIEYDNLPDGDRFSVTSTPAVLPDDEDIYLPGYTTKNEHDGLGLPTVKTLVEFSKGGKLSHRIDGKSVSFIVFLPRGRS